MAEIIQFVRPACAMKDFDESVEAMKEHYGPDLGGFALVCWNRAGTEQAASYTAGPIDVEELPEYTKDALEARLYEDEDEIDFQMETNDNKIIDKLTTVGIIRDEE